MKRLSNTLLAFILLTLSATSLSAQENTPTQLREPTSAPYQVGDYYNENGMEGVVFQVSEDGTSGKIIHLTQSKGVRMWASTSEGKHRFLGASDMYDGAANCRVVTQFDGWEEKFPAFAWCIARGKGWYLPAIEELRKLIMNPNTHRLVNDRLNALGATPLPARNEWVDFWSSTERDFCYDNGEYCAYILNSRNGPTKDNSKRLYARVRAVAAFPIVEVISEKSPQKNVTSAPYKVGDYYNDGTMRGVVFEVNAEGTHGKIVSMSQPSEDQLWCVGEEQKRVIGSTDRKSGKANMAKVKSIEGWQSLYPAFAWCASLGEGWYLPAIEEIKSFMKEDVHTKINATLDSYLATKLHTLHPTPPTEKWEDYWSSTEIEELYIPDEEYEGDVCAYALGYFIINSTEYQVTKRNDSSVRAVAEF